MRGIYLATHVNDAELDDRRFWKIYAKAEELEWPVFLHPIDTIGRERTTRYYLRNLLGNPYDTGLAAASLVFGGVLDAFPKLEVNLPHAGGTFPWLIGRLDHGTKVRPELRHMKALPSAYLRRFTYDTIGHNDQITYNLIRLVGADRVVMGSDYCFDMGLDGSAGRYRAPRRAQRRRARDDRRPDGGETAAAKLAPVRPGHGAGRRSARLASRRP